MRRQLSIAFVLACIGTAAQAQAPTPNAKGYLERNIYGAYTLNNITAKKSEDGSITIQFGGCNGKTPDCLPIVKGWNYTVRLYRPRAGILDGSWTSPEATPSLVSESVGARRLASRARAATRGKSSNLIGIQ